LARTNRFLAYAKGLIEQGESVVVLCILPPSKNHLHPDHSGRGIYQGIEYSYTGGSALASNSRPRWLLQRIRNLIGGLRELWRRRSKNQLDVVFFPSMRALDMACVLISARLRGIKVVYEICEYPFLGTEGQRLRRLEVELIFRVLTRLCNGVVVISTALEKLYRPQMSKHASLLRVPAIVDFSRFERCSLAGSSPIKGQYVAWCGSDWGSKDGVLQLVEAFIRIAVTHLDTKLVLIAPQDDSTDFKRVQDMVQNSVCADRIVITGRISQADMPTYLGNASVLALARPSSIQAEYGFPTKLPEYLATGRPVLVTKVGDIPQYLTDGEDAYLVEPDDIGGFAEKLDYILGHPEEAQRVGTNGKTMAEQEFSSTKHSKRLVSFCRQLR